MFFEKYDVCNVKKKIYMSVVIGLDVARKFGVSLLQHRPSAIPPRKYLGGR